MTDHAAEIRNTSFSTVDELRRALATYPPNTPVSGRYNEVSGVRIIVCDVDGDIDSVLVVPSNPVGGK